MMTQFFKESDIFITKAYYQMRLQQIKIIIIFYMKIILTILLVSLCTSTILLQSNTQLKLSSPGQVGQSVFSATGYTKKITQAPDAVWIWSKGWNEDTCVNPIIIQGDFFVGSSNPIHFHASADDNFTLYIDGKQTFTGFDHNKMHSKNLTLTCGTHTYKIVAYNVNTGCGSGNTAGLVFAFVQDTATTTKCYQKLQTIVSNTQLKLSSPGHVGQSVVKATAYTTKITQAPDAVWIWSKGWNEDTCVNPIIIQGSFIVESSNPIHFHASADDNFTLYIDGKQTFTGFDHNKMHSTNLTLTCGTHTYKIVAYNANTGCSGNTAGLVFAFVQDTFTNQCPKKLPLVSNTELRLSSPGHVGQSVYRATAYTTKITQAPDAVWIWSKGWNEDTCVNPIIIQGSFIMESGNPIHFHASADDNFTLYIDGKQTFTGFDHNKMHSKNLTLTCTHTYKIVAYNVNTGCGSGNTAGLVFAFVQDTATTTKCYQKLQTIVSNTQLKLSSPGHVGQSVVKATAYTTKITQAPDAVWIWSKGWNEDTCVNPIIIQGSFIVESSNPIHFHASADDNFTLYIDGKQTFTGFDHNKMHSTNLTLTCGTHTYKIVAYNANTGCSGNTAGLVFAFVQDTFTNQCPKKLPIVSNTELRLSSPGHVGQSVVKATAYTTKITQAPDAVWIWSKGWNEDTCVNPIIIQGSFIVESSNPIHFHASADDNFTLYIDGKQTFTGFDHNKMHSTNFTLTCGTHTYKIVAYNANTGCSGNTAGLVFAFVQDTATTTKCYQKLQTIVSNTQLKLSSPGHVGQSVYRATAYTTQITQAPDAVWIWSKGWNETTCVNPIIIQGDFFVGSSNPIHFHASADDNFTLYIDGKQTFTGFDHNKMHSTNLTLTCGPHTYKIVAYNADTGCSGNTAGLVFAFVQDSSTNYCIGSPTLAHLRKSTHFKKFTHLVSFSKHAAKKSI